MLKKLVAFLFSLFIVPLMSISPSSFSHQEVVYAEEEETLYPYTEERDDVNFTVTRTYDDVNLGPSLVQHFCAPSGYVFTCAISGENFDALTKEMEDAGNYYAFIYFRFNYETFGMNVTVDDFGPLFFNDELPIEENRGYFRDIALPSINDRLILEMKEVLVPTTVKLVVEVNFTARINGSYYNYTFVLKSKVIDVKPFNEEDFIFLHVHHYEDVDAGENSLVVSAEPLEGLFYELPLYNPYGYHTKTTHSAWDQYTGEMGQKADYTISLIAYDSVPLGTIDRMGISLTFPPEPIPVRAKIEFVDDKDVSHTFYSKQIIISNPHINVSIDGEPLREAIQKNVEHIFSFHVDDYEAINLMIFQARIIAHPYRLTDVNQCVVLYNKTLPATGEKDKIYYIPSDEEIALHNQNKDDEYLSNKAEGTYYVYDDITSSFKQYRGVEILDSEFLSDEDDEFDYQELGYANVAIPFAGKWYFEAFFNSYRPGDQYYYISNSQLLDVIDLDDTAEEIILNVPDHLNLIPGVNDVIINASVSSYDESVDYYYDYTFSKMGVVDVVSIDEGNVVIRPMNPGTLNITIGIESILFPRITKTIFVRVLDMVYDVAQIEVPEGFHHSGKDLTCAINIRGFTHFQNLDIKWKVVNKKGKDLPEEQIEVHNDATMTIINPDSDDYTITASYDGIQLDKLTIQVRYIDMNSFLRANVWWIIMITLGFVALLVFVKFITSKGKTTLEYIEKVYDVFHQCYADDRLSEGELKRIKKAINKCLRRCEDLNIEALNQYEKAIRYLRKSLFDTKVLLKGYEDTSIEDKGVKTNQLDRDLSKALYVAKEIESAKELIELSHAQANRYNYETLKDESGGKKKKDKSDF